MWLWRLSLQVPCLRCRNNLDLRMIVCNIKVEAPRKAMTPSGRKLLKVPWTPDYISIFHNYVYSLGYILSVSGHQKLRPDPARPDDPPFWPDPTTSLVQTHLLTERHMKHENRVITKKTPIYGHIVFINYQQILVGLRLYTDLGHLVCGWKYA